MKVGVVMVNYQGWPLARRAIKSLRDIACHQDVWLVDNSVPSEVCPSDLQDDAVHLIAPGVNLGFAGGCNLGIRAALEAGCDGILLLNPDTRCKMDFIEPLVETLERCPRVAAASPTILDDSPLRSVQFAGARVRWWSGGPSHCLQRPANSGVCTETDFVTGCAVLLRGHAVQAVGEFEEGYFLYFEDADYCERLRRAGWTLAYRADAEIFHHLSSSSGFQSRDYVFYFARNRLLYLWRWAPWPHALVYSLIHVFIKLPAAFLVFGVGRRRWDVAYAFLCGVIDAARGRSGPRIPSGAHGTERL